MIYKTIAACIIFLLCNNAGFAQSSTYTVTDSMPATINGLEMGYRIKSEEEKEVSKKGNFSRCAIKFYVKNIADEAKIILYKTGFTLGTNTSNQLVQFNCLNATGARLTARSALINAPACNVMADVEDKDANGKTIINRRLVQIGYWIKPGQSLFTDAIVIVPLNDKPDVRAVYLAASLQATATAFTPQDNAAPAYVTGDNIFYKIKNVWKNTYINNQYGTLDCSNIDNGWWSAQWQLIPVQGSSFYLIKNRWKSNYISTETQGNMVSFNSQAPASMWMLEAIPGTNQCRIKNAVDGSYLNILSGNLQSTKISPGAPAATWILTNE